MKLIWRTLRRLLPILPPEERAFLWWFVVLSSALALIDIAALGILALALGSMVQYAPIPFPLIGEVGTDGYVWVLLVVSLLIILKSGLNVLLQWFATRKFAKYELTVDRKGVSLALKVELVESLASP